MSPPEHTSGVADNTAGSALPPDIHLLPVVQPPVAPLPAERRRRTWFWGAGVALAAGLGLVLYFQPWLPGPVPVATEIAAFAPVTRVLAVNGRIAALHSVDVRAVVGGPLAAVLVSEGDTVRANAALARVDAASQQAVLRQAVAGMDAALVAQAQAQATYARTEALGANVARSLLESAETAVQSATQEVARMTALVDQAQIQLANFTIRAPMDGTVLALNVDPGQIIDPATVLLTLADLSALSVETDVDEAYATQIRAGLPAVLQLAGDMSAHDGRVSFVSQRVDPATGGLAVKLAFDQAVNAPVGLTVTANIIVDQQDAALTAPRSAIRTGDAGAAVFVVADGIALRRAVSVIDWPAARLIVTGGLVPGDLLIVDATGISDGQAVQAGPR
ncbi:efflux RND transporter periplasmic adaptor subunit [Pararhodobacter sp.]|uniref:efflux RND transporter periplasmic adaptor subunit n=1 Tax=Pararhodobacter sp. TaxID=2127056 RepID=UPI002FDCFC6A